MNELKIVINNLPPMPRNRSHVLTRGMLIKTPLAREFEKDLTYRLQEFRQEITSFVSNFTIVEHYINLSYTIYTPKEELITKAGYISAKSVDFDAHKLMTDVIFKEVGINDKYARKVDIFTPISHDGFWNYVVILRIKPLQELYL